MIPQISENFPKIDGKQYATLTQATVNVADMGESTITADVKIDGEITPDFSQEWSVTFKGVKYVLPHRMPTASKENTSLDGVYSLTFEHSAIRDLKRYLFPVMEVLESGTPVADKYIADVQLNVENFCDKLGDVLRYYFDNRISVDYNKDWGGATDAKPLSIHYSHIWNVLLDLYKTYGVHWSIVPVPDVENYLERPEGWSQPVVLGGTHTIASYEFADGEWDGDTITFGVDVTTSQPILGYLSVKFYNADGTLIRQDQSGTQAIGGRMTLTTTLPQDAASATFVIVARRGVIASGEISRLSLTKGDCSDYPTKDRFTIRIGYDATEIDHIFRYGFDGGLMKIERQAQSDDIRNMLLGRGGENNLPLRYFKDTDPDNKLFAADPDWIPELKNIYFDRLRGATFRSYIQGWKAGHYNADGTPKTDSAGMHATADDAPAGTYDPAVWAQGYNDTKFDPVEYVSDFESISKYGEFIGGLDDNDDIYPTIQGVVVDGLGRIDQAVDVEQIMVDAETDAEEVSPDLSKAVLDNKASEVERIGPNAYKTYTIKGSDFVVPEGQVGNLEIEMLITKAYIYTYYTTWSPPEGVVVRSTKFPAEGSPGSQVQLYGIMTVRVINTETEEEVSAVGVPPGRWRYEVTFTIHNVNDSRDVGPVVSMETTLTTGEPKDVEELKDTFKIWVKNIWQTQKLETETAEQYAKRVWEPILGDRLGNEAKVMFTSGALAASEDYEFTIAAIPTFDQSKTLNGVPSHWCIKCAKSDADQKSLGLPVPNSKRNGLPGDTFCFIGIDMPHIYVLWAERELDDWKKDQLKKVSDIQPSWNVTTDRVRLSNCGEAGALIDELAVGRQVRVADSRLIDKVYETFYIQSLAYTFRQPYSDDAALNPDVEMVLGNDYSTTGNPVSMMQGEIEALQNQLGSVGNVAQVVRSVGDRTYQRKDGLSDISLSPVLYKERQTFAGGWRTDGFVSSLMAGHGAGVDALGNMEVESLRVRSAMEVMELIVNKQSSQSSDTIFTEGDTIESVSVFTDYTEASKFTLRLREEYEGYTTSLMPNDILRGVYRSDGQSGTGTDAEFYTSWMRVNSVDREENTIEVILFPDEDTPAGMNYPPAELMKIIRWGNQENDARKRLFALSSTEGRLYKLSGVDRPKIDFGNYEVVLGTFPEPIHDRIPAIAEGESGVYAKHLVVQNIWHLDFEGKPVPVVRDRGLYDAAATYYSGDELRPETGDYEQSDVWYDDCRWRCQKTSTTSVPSTDTTDWALVADSQGKPGGKFVTIRDEEDDENWTLGEVNQLRNKEFQDWIYYGNETVVPGDYALMVIFVTDKNGKSGILTGLVTAVRKIEVGSSQTAQLVTVDHTKGSFVFAEDGAPGRRGPTGKRGIYIPSPRLWAEYEDGYEFQAGGEDDERQDIVLMKYTTVQPDGSQSDKVYAYACAQTHVKSAEKPPSVGKPYWDAGMQWTFVSTELLLANRGRINNLYVDELEAIDKDNDKKRITIRPQELAMRIYDDTGAESAVFDGNKLTSDDFQFTQGSFNATAHFDGASVDGVSIVGTNYDIDISQEIKFENASGSVTFNIPAITYSATSGIPSPIANADRERTEISARLSVWAVDNENDAREEIAAVEFPKLSVLPKVVDATPASDGSTLDPETPIPPLDRVQATETQTIDPQRLTCKLPAGKQILLTLAITPKVGIGGGWSVSAFTIGLSVVKNEWRSHYGSTGLLMAQNTSNYFGAIFDEQGELDFRVVRDGCPAMKRIIFHGVISGAAKTPEFINVKSIADGALTILRTTLNSSTKIASIVLGRPRAWAEGNFTYSNTEIEINPSGGKYNIQPAASRGLIPEEMCTLQIPYDNDGIIYTTHITAYYH